MYTQSHVFVAHRRAARNKWLTLHTANTRHKGLMPGVAIPESALPSACKTCCAHGGVAHIECGLCFLFLNQTCTEMFHTCLELFKGIRCELRGQQARESVREIVFMTSYAVPTANPCIKRKTHHACHDLSPPGVQGPRPPLYLPIGVVLAI